MKNRVRASPPSDKTISFTINQREKIDTEDDQYTRDSPFMCYLQTLQKIKYHKELINMLVR